MVRIACVLPWLLLCCTAARSAAKPPVYLWFEPEWFDGVEGSFTYWTGTAKPTGHWGVAGPGVGPEWTQGGESEWNSMGAPAEETKASCRRDFVVPRAGAYRVWVRYVDHRKKTEPFRVAVSQGGRDAVAGELGVTPVVPPNDEYQLYWGFSFGWGALDGRLGAGPARLVLSIDKAGEAWRQVDAVLITDDLAYTPVGREKPPFAYFASFALRPAGAAWRGEGKAWGGGAASKRVALAGRDFMMWTGVSADPKWWGKQNVETLSLHDVLFEHGPPPDVKAVFQKQFAGRKDVPVLSWPHLVPGFYLGESPDLSPGAPLRRWLERTKTPFYVLTNYAGGNYTDKTGPATYAALAGPLASQFLGYVHGEAFGTAGVAPGDKPLGATRRAHADALGKSFVRQQADAWGKVYKTTVDERHWSSGISCLAAESTALAHLYHETGARTVGYEEDATNVHVPMRVAFERGAARQYGGAWINYASGNFGDACNYFTQEPRVPRGAKAWFHSKYAITDGVSACWYRKLYYLNYLGGASSIYWEQNLENQWLLPGPGTHPVQLSPFGRATEDFQAFVSRLPDRGEPYAPVALFLSYGHGYDRVNNECRMLRHFREDKNDLELRELFNVCWHPTAREEGQPIAPDGQSMPGGVYGNVFDVLVDRPARAKALLDYPVTWAAGDVDLMPLRAALEEYLRRGGTLVVNVEAARGLPAEWLGFKATGKTKVCEEWAPDGAAALAATPYEVADVALAGAKVLAWAAPKVPLIVRRQVGAGAVIVTLCPRLLGQDERAHPALPWLMNGVTADLLPVEVRRADGTPLTGEVMYQVNRTKDGWLVLLVSTRGVDKTQHGVARVDRRAFVDVAVRTSLALKTAKEWTEPRELTTEKKEGATEVRVRVHPGDVQVIGLVTQPAQGGK